MAACGLEIGHVWTMETMARNERLSPVVLSIAVAALLGIGVAAIGWRAN